MRKNSEKSYGTIDEVLTNSLTDVNLALHGTAKQYTTYTDSEGNSYTADLAIKGPANNNWEDGCSSTDGIQAIAWWGLFLPQLAYITNIKSYYRKDEAHRMNDFRLYFANGSVYEKTELCFRDIGKQAHSNLNQSIDCNLSPTRNIYYFNRNTFIELCYIEINGCWKGFWGENCTVPCPPTCIDQHCNPANGSCVWGCNTTNCMNKNCSTNTLSGACLGGCVLGRAGQYCNKYKTTATGGNAVYCSNTTDKWNDGTLLYSGPRLNTDIITFAVCKYLTYVPPLLIGSKMVELCEIEIGGCSYRRYGDICEHVCPEHCLGQGRCDLISGDCLSGCSDGWVGEKCDQACDEDKFGGQCLRDCSVNCLSSPCDHVTGQCKSGCLKGWEGLNCSKECSKGNFGWNCNATCDGCIVNECNHINGVCKIDSVCKPGFVYGKYCNEKCAYGYFGFNCAYLCETCFNQSCDIFEGIAESVVMTATVVASAKCQVTHIVTFAVGAFGMCGVVGYVIVDYYENKRWLLLGIAY
ncbi:unnamed protein product [Mytilus edulis]|uniref:Uncharacterized protein n=1 Tax=Mytilus edulis TaxID=6550 RepID=A0A8S3TNM0_MYTED|nr:unnamed protein product [Mytilus edulis]